MTPRTENRLVLLGLGLWLAVNGLTAARSPTVWHDEVMFSDAAVRWHLGKGLTSTAWALPPDRPALLNGPLHTLLLTAWLGIWGIGPTAVRSLGLVLAAVAAFGLWRLCRSRRWVDDPRLRLAGVAVFLCSTGTSFAYRSGRHDMLGVLLLTGLAAGLSPDSPADGGSGRRTAPLGVLGLSMLLPFAGLQVPVYAGFVAVALVCLGGRQWLERLIPVGIGVAAGGVLLAAMHGALGTWSWFVGFTREQAAASLGEKLAGLPRAWLADPSLLPLAAFLAWEIGRRPPSRGALRRDPRVLGLAAAALIPPAMALAGKYAVYYGWMAMLPVLGAVLRTMADRGRESDH